MQSIILVLNMPLVYVWMMYCEFGESFNKHPSRSCAELGSDIEWQKYVIRKWLRSEIALKLLQE